MVQWIISNKISSVDFSRIGTTAAIKNSLKYILLQARVVLRQKFCQCGTINSTFSPRILLNIKHK